MQTVRARIASLEILPEMGSPVDEESLFGHGYRELIIGNYRVIYRFRVDTCYILSVLRAEQDLTRAFSDPNFL